MSDHAWTCENIAAYVVGGLTDAEITRVDAHVRQCPDCAAALSAARQGRLVREGRRFRCGERVFSASTIGNVMSFGLMALQDGRLVCTSAGEAALSVPPVAAGVAHYRERKARRTGGGDEGAGAGERPRADPLAGARAWG